MKKLVILAAILMIVPTFAMAGMGLLNESSLNDVTGQTGITINQSLQASVGSLTWTDDDGFSSTTDAAGGVQLATIALNDGAATPGPISMNGLTVDANDGTLVIGLPGMTGTLTVGAINLIESDGTTVTGSLGALSVSNFSLSGSTVTILPH